MGIRIGGREMSGSAIGSTLLGVRHERGNSIGQNLAADILRPQIRYNDARSRGIEQAASRAGNQAGYAQGYQQFNGAQATADYNYTRGVDRAVGRTFSERGYNDTMGQLDPSYQPRGQQNYRNQGSQGYDSGIPTSGGRGQVAYRSPASVQRDTDIEREQSLAAAFRDSGKNPENLTLSQTITADNGKTYTIENDRPLNEQEAGIVANALAYTDRARAGDRKEEDKLIEAMQAGLSPFAVIEYEGGKQHRLDEYARKEVGRNAEGLVQQQQRSEINAAFNEFRNEQRASSGQGRGSAQPSVYEYSPNAPISDFARLAFDDKVLVDGRIMNDAMRSSAIVAMLDSVKNPRDAEKLYNSLNEYVGQNGPQVANKIKALLDQDSNLTPGSDAANLGAFNSQKIIDNIKRINEFYPQGAEQLAQTIAQNAELQQAAAQATQRYNSRPATADLAQAQILGEGQEAEALRQRYKNAISQQESWDKMAKDNPIAGMFMMLLRPLIESFNPDSNPMAILEEAASKGHSISAPDAVASRLSETARGKVTATTATPEPSAPETEAKAETQVAATGATPAPAPEPAPAPTAPAVAETPAPAPAAGSPSPESTTTPGPVATQNNRYASIDLSNLGLTSSVLGIQNACHADMPGPVTCNANPISRGAGQGV